MRSRDILTVLEGGNRPSADVISFTACRLCGDPGHLVEMLVHGKVLAKASLCNPCEEKCRQEFDRLKRIRKVFKDEGVDDDHANALMVELQRLEEEG